jgi:hypothetical protein
MNAAFLQSEARGKGRCPFPLDPYPRLPKPSLRSGKSQQDESHLTIPITCLTINSPASLRSDPLIGLDKISDRFQTRTLIAFAGIRNSIPEAAIQASDGRFPA